METNQITGRITSFTVSSGEKRKAVDQFQPNDYHSSVSVEFTTPVQMDNMEDLKKLFPLMIAATGICKINNRASQIRDGINPALCKEVPEATFDTEGHITVAGSVPSGKEKRVLLSDLGIKLSNATPALAQTLSNPIAPVFSSDKPSRKKNSHDNLPEVKK